MNVQMITGNLIKDAEVSMTKTGKKFIRFGVSVYNNDPTGDSEYKSEIYNVQIFADADSKLDGMLTQGTKVAVSGDAFVHHHDSKRYNNLKSTTYNITVLSSGGTEQAAGTQDTAPAQTQSDPWNSK